MEIERRKGLGWRGLRLGRLGWSAGLPVLACVASTGPSPPASTHGVVVPGEETGPDGCTLEEQKANLLAVFKQEYLWADAMPKVNLADYNDLGDLLDALRYRKREPDGREVVVDTWSSVGPSARFTASHGEGKVVGTGVAWDFNGGRPVRAMWVHPGSPAHQAGIRRGTRLIRVNDVPAEDVRDEVTWRDVAGPKEPGERVTLEFETQSGDRQTATLTRTWFRPQPALSAVVDAPSGLRVGYVQTRPFVGTSADEHRQAFEHLKQRGVNELVVDMRYNWGGYYNQAATLASLIAGNAHAQKPLAILTRNGKGEPVSRVYLEEEGAALELSRVVVLISEQTASAAELMINGLEPYLDVTLVGAAHTSGKPYGHDTFDYCGVTLQPVTTAVSNASGIGHFVDGLAADCVAEDGLSHELGTPEEPMLAAALHWLDAGRCKPSASH